MFWHDVIHVHIRCLHMIIDICEVIYMHIWVAYTDADVVVCWILIVPNRQLLIDISYL